ncbi:MAG TPA: ClpXP protease specificity-enhancing factor [Chromatiaceae bacterium]|jgi:stringent starvation protein B|nr:MAG: hypothetical protein N838_18880 [Thiohalocapsa sp. PB-PSB1]QQO57446.1 MAG: ClpXP protease specificity-enhancing factor [Thiohalocapsa sp. PB-PSB1]HBG96157.1 ClpXP protease specificity-enhancing factor [Chromatiaceae bacterium]HCS92168.1 ClpXP protease specificity-enhancing factor [Chromatiaceae bacterium]
MTSNRPYLIRALYEWIIDNDLTPHLIVDAEYPAAVVPRAFVDDGRIVLNIAPLAVHALQMDNDSIRFSARFGGSPFAVTLPPRAVLGVYARENGQGMLFPDEEPAADDASQVSSDAGSDTEDKKPARPTLRVIK